MDRLRIVNFVQIIQIVVQINVVLLNFEFTIIVVKCLDTNSNCVKAKYKTEVNQQISVDFFHDNPFV